MDNWIVCTWAECRSEGSPYPLTTGLTLSKETSVWDLAKCMHWSLLEWWIAWLSPDQQGLHFTLIEHFFHYWWEVDKSREMSGHCFISLLANIISSKYNIFDQLLVWWPLIIWYDTSSHSAQDSAFFLLDLSALLADGHCSTRQQLWCSYLTESHKTLLAKIISFIHYLLDIVIIIFFCTFVS